MKKIIGGIFDGREEDYNALKVIGDRDGVSFAVVDSDGDEVGDVVTISKSNVRFLISLLNEIEVHQRNQTDSR